MKKNKYEKLHSIVTQLMLVAAYPVVFHLAALIGSSNQHKDQSLGDMAFPLISLMIWVGLFIATVCTGLIKRHFKRMELEAIAGESSDEGSEKTDSNDDSEDDSEEDDNDIEKVKEKHRKQVEALQKKRNKTKSWIVFTSLIIVSFLIRLPMLGTFQRWDAGEYFYTVGTSVQDYTFSLSNFLYNFSVAYHLNYGFTSFIAIPLFISSRSVMAITVWQMIFSVLAVMALYRIFRIDFSFTRSRSAVAAMVIGNVPIFLGLTAYCTPDYYMVLFFIFALYFHSREWHILEVFMLIMMCFTKENAALIVFGYYGVRIVCRFIFVSLSRARELKTFADKKRPDPRLEYDILDEGTDQLKAREEALEKGDLSEKEAELTAELKAELEASSDYEDENSDSEVTKKKRDKVTFKQRVRLATHTPDFWVALTVGIIFVAAMLLKGANWADKVSTSGAAPTTLSFEKPYIYLKIKQYMGSNFAWLVFVYFLIAFKNIIIDRKWKNLKGTGWLVFGGMCGALACFAAFGMFFHISPLERYNTFFAVGLAFITMAVMGVDIVNRSSYVFFGGILATLLAIESFVTIDPVTRGFYKQVPIGEKTMNYESEQIAYFGDGLVTNYQYAWLDKAFDKLLADIDYDGSEALYFPVKETGVESGVQFEGNGCYFRIGWFDEKKKRDYYDYNMSGWSELNICAVSSANTWFPYAYVPYGKKLNKQYMTSRAYMCFIPYFEELGVSEEDHLKSISEYYYLGEEKGATKYRGTIGYYPMVQQDNYIEGLGMGDVVGEIKSLTANDEEIEDAAGVTDANEGSKTSVNYTNDSATNFGKNQDANNGIIQNRIDRLFKNRMTGYLRVNEVNEDARVDIEPMDSIHLSVELYDSNGKRVRTSHDEEEYVVSVGTGELIDEIDDALLKMKAGDTDEVEFVVPDGYPELEIYSGQTLTAKLQPLYIACSLTYVIDDAKKQEIYDATVEEVTENFNRDYNEYKMRMYLQDNVDILSEIVASDSTDKAGDLKKALHVSDAKLTEVQTYYYQYLETISMTKEEFTEEILHATPEEYEMAMVIIAAQ